MANVNENEIRVVGLSRSGNHAIVGWLLSQARGRVCSLNCAEPQTNPFASARPLAPGEPGWRASFDGFEIEAERRGRFTRKDWLVHSYEDTFLDYLADPRHEARRDEWVGRSRRRLDLLILRDPFNLFASRLASGVGVSPRTAAKIWSQHAREFLGLTRHLAPSRVLVSYNDWATSPAYRRRLAGELGLEFDDAATSHVATCAGGSSFEGTSRQGRAEEMAVLDRWRHYASDRGYRSLFDPELVGLSDHIFGPVAPPDERRALLARAA